MKGQDHYRVLGITPDADQAVIKAAFRSQMKRHHPDLNPGREDANRISASINLAYEVLGDPARRSRYDWERLRAARNSRAHASHSGAQGSRYRDRRHTWTPPQEETTQQAEDPGPQQRSDARDESSQATLSAVGRVLWTLAVAVMLGIEMLSVPAIMLGIGVVLCVFGALITFGVATSYFLMVVLGTPTVALGLAIIKRNADEMPRVVGLLIACAGVFLFVAGVYLTVTTAPIPVALTLVGAAITGLAVRTGRAYGSFTSRRIHLVS